jgi:hypothetical protein
VRAQAQVRAQAADRWPVVAAVPRSVICKTSSTFLPVAWAAVLGHRRGLAGPAQASVVERWLVVHSPVAHWQAVRLPNSCRTGRAEVLATAGVPAAATSPRLYQRDLVAADVLTLGAQDNQAIGQATSVVPANQAIVPVTSGGQVVPAIDQLTLVDPGDRAIGQEISADPVDQATDQATSAGRADPAIDRVTSVCPADRETESLPRIYPVASAIARDGKIGATSIATTSATGGRTTLAISTIGSTTIGGATPIWTGRTTQASATGDGPPGIA